jgi:photosystem II stability/assembly factor-like uncharacterized protein
VADVAGSVLPDLPSPVLALGFLGGRLWLGGLGGVAHEGSSGQPPQGPLTAVAALTTADGTLIAGGAEGIARRIETPDGAQWEPAEVQSGGSPIVAFAGFDETALVAATLGDGVLRSTDGGRTWVTSNFGLDDLDVSAVACGPEDGPFLAGTAGGVFHSRDGQGWRMAKGTEGRAIAALTYTQAGSAIAVTEDGAVLRSADAGLTWAAAGNVPGTATSVAEALDRLLVGTVDAGIWSSADDGDSWIVDLADAPAIYCLAGDTSRVFAGSATGLHFRTGAGATWQAVPAPPTHDFTHSILWQGRPLFAGARSGLAHQEQDGGWSPLSDTPLPLLCVAVTPKDALLVSSPAGLFLRDGDSWTGLVEGEDGQVGRMSFRPDGTGLASRATHGDQLLRTRDGGVYWQPIPAPFGVLAPIELQMFEETVMVKTLDQRTNVLTVWGSRDDGTSWEIVWQGPESAGARI